MAIDCVTTAYGPPAHEALAWAVARAKGDDPLAPVTVVVPNHYVGLAARRALGRREHGGTRGIAAVAFHTAYSLAEHLGGAEMADQGRRGVSSTVIAAAVRAALRRDPGRFRGVETHPATERALTRAHRELSELDRAQLAALSKQSPRAADVVRVHREVAAALEDGFSNEQQLARGAAAAVRARPSETRRRLGPMIVFLPQSVTGSQAGLLRAVADAQKPPSLRAHRRRRRRRHRAASLRRLGADFDASVLPGAREAIRPAGTVRAVSVSDADDEARHAVRAVVDAARAGTPLGRCAILYGVETPYVRLVGDGLDAAGISRCGATASTVQTSLLGRSLLEMLALRDEGFSRRAVMAWLAGAPVSIKRPDPDAAHGDGDAADKDNLSNRTAPGARDGLIDETAPDTADPPHDEATPMKWQGVPSSAWEREARSARVESGIDSWRQRLDRYAADCAAEAERLTADEDQMWHGVRLRRSAERASELLAFVEELHRDLDPQPAPRTWADLAAWCQQLVHKYLGGRLRRSWPD